MPDASTIKQFMDYGALWAFAVLVVLVIWKKVLPWGDKYIASVEKLHDSIGTNMTSQTAVSQSQAETLKVHDEGMRKVAQEACAFCRKFIAKEFPSSVQEANEAFAKIEQIIGDD